MEYTIKMIQQAATVHDLLPDYHYQFNEIEPNPEAEKMYESLVEFISTNKDLALTDIIQKDEFSKGFKRALALTKLWLDSIHIEAGEENGTGKTSN